MESGRRFWSRWAAGLVAWVAALVVASFLDLRLAGFAHLPGSPLAWAVFYLAEVPSWALLVGALLTLLGQRRGWRWPRMPRELAISIVLLMLIYPVGVTRLLKLLWGRVRFENLPASLAGYTPFYRPAGVGAGQSFPSGHVAMSMLWTPIPYYLLWQGPRRAALLSWLLVTSYGALVVWGRMRAGDHFLSDGLFSAGAMLLIAPLLVRWQLRKQRR